MVTKRVRRELEKVGLSGKDVDDVITEMGDLVEKPEDTPPPPPGPTPPPPTPEFDPFVEPPEPPEEPPDDEEPDIDDLVDGDDVEPEDEDGVSGEDDGDDTEPSSNPNDDDDAFNADMWDTSKFDDLPAPTAEEIDNMDLPDDMDKGKLLEKLDKLNISTALKNRARIRAVKSDILKRIVPPSDEITYEGGKEIHYESGLRVAKSHMWSAEKSIMGFGALHAGTEFGVTKKVEILPPVPGERPSGMFSIFWDVSWSNHAKNGRFEGSEQGVFYSGMECMVAILMEAQCRRDLVSTYVTPSLSGMVLPPIKIAGERIKPESTRGFDKKLYFHKSTDYDSILEVIFSLKGPDNYEDYATTLPYIIRDLIVGERIKRGLTIFICDIGAGAQKQWLKQIVQEQLLDNAKWFRLLHEYSDILYLHITPVSSNDKTLLDAAEKRTFGMSGQEFFDQIVPDEGIKYVNVGDGTNLSNMCLDALAKFGGSEFRNRGGKIL
jgi:hypothetical protein